jgi:GNAT superfamily N-acetyltransferase
MNTEVVLDDLRPGDLGWVIARHGALYAQEHGFDQRFEALVARIAADFVDRRDASCERGWIARRGDANLGCVFVVRADAAEFGANLAQLRLLLVEPAARGLRIGDRLVGACEAYARDRGYRGMVLWTNAKLDAARAIYRRHGWTLQRSESHHRFGQDLVGEIWSLDF